MTTSGSSTRGRESECGSEATPTESGKPCTAKLYYESLTDLLRKVLYTYLTCTAGQEPEVIREEKARCAMTGSDGREDDLGR